MTLHNAKAQIAWGFFKKAYENGSENSKNTIATLKEVKKDYRPHFEEISPYAGKIDPKWDISNTQSFT